MSSEDASDSDELEVDKFISLDLNVAFINRDERTYCGGQFLSEICCLSSEN